MKKLLHQNLIQVIYLLSHLNDRLLLLKQVKVVLLLQLSVLLLPPNDKEHRLFGYVLLWKNVKTKKGEMVDQAVCKYCQYALSAKSNGGTGHLRRHMETCQTKHTPQDPTQTQLSQYGSGPFGITSFRYSQHARRIGLVYCCSRTTFNIFRR